MTRSFPLTYRPPMISDADERVRPSAPVRATTYAILAAVLLCGFVRIEAWPLTSFAMFSKARTERVNSWVVQLVDEQGREHALYPIALDQGNRGIALQMTTFHGRTSLGQERVCSGWAEVGRRAGLLVMEIRVYQTTRLLSRRIGERGEAPSSTLGFACREGRVTTG